MVNESEHNPVLKLLAVSWGQINIHQAVKEIKTVINCNVCQQAAVLEA